MLIYFDQNALSNLAKLPRERQRDFTDLLAMKKVTVVLSGWHALETANWSQTELLLDFVDVIPNLALAGGSIGYDLDIQTYEFVAYFLGAAIPRERFFRPCTAQQFRQLVQRAPDHLEEFSKGAAVATKALQLLKDSRVGRPNRQKRKEWERLVEAIKRDDQAFVQNKLDQMEAERKEGDGEIDQDLVDRAREVIDGLLEFAQMAGAAPAQLDALQRIVQLFHDTTTGSMPSREQILLLLNMQASRPTEGVPLPVRANVVGIRPSQQDEYYRICPLSARQILKELGYEEREIADRFLELRRHDYLACPSIRVDQVFWKYLNSDDQRPAEKSSLGDKGHLTHLPYVDLFFTDKRVKEAVKALPEAAWCEKYSTVGAMIQKIRESRPRSE